MRKRYPSDISKEAFEEIRPLLESVRKQTKPRTVHAYFAKWSEPDPDGFSVLERALKKCGWRGSYKTGAQVLDELFNRRRTERQEHR